MSWTFREAIGFFDVVTYTGNGANRTIAHSLGVAPGMIIIKRTDSTSPWTVYHRSLANTEYSVLNTTAAKATGATTYWNSTTATNAVFSLGTSTDVNTNTATYVAYLFAHDTSTDGIIQCGTFSGNTTVTLGWEPQYVLIKRTDSTDDWKVLDTTRTWNLSAAETSLLANTSGAETTSTDYGNPIATGFVTLNHTGTFIYMAIRKGLMKPPTDATKIFAINLSTGTGAARTISGLSITTGPDLVITKRRNGSGNYGWTDRLRGVASQLQSNKTDAETTVTDEVTSFNMDGVTLGTSATQSYSNLNTATYLNLFFKEQRYIFDKVRYTGTGAAHTESHNLGVAPELMIVKCQSAINDWAVYYGDNTDYMLLNSTAATADDATYWNDTSPGTSSFTVGTNADVNTNTATYMAYLFSSYPGISKIGTYSGSVSAVQVDCGFSAGARFVMIKRIDSTGDWYHFDTSRGIVSGADQYLRFNLITNEPNSDVIDPYTPGFTLVGTSGAVPGVNASGGTYLYMAFA